MNTSRLRSHALALKRVRTMVKMYLIKRTGIYEITKFADNIPCVCHVYHEWPKLLQLHILILTYCKCDLI